MDKPRLRIFILGSPMVTWDGVQLNIARQQIRWLLIYLAAQTQPVHRDTLCQVFWPTEDDEKAHKLLREALSKLRAALPDPSVLIAHAGEVFLDPQKAYVDSREFKQLTDPFLESTEVNRDAQLPDWLYLQLKRAYELCRGPLRMTGVNVPIPIGYENFLSLASQQYDYLRLRIEERMASHNIAIGNLDEAILWLGRAVEIDPLNDENNFLILSCLKDSGRNKDALDYIAYLENLYQQSSKHPLPESFYIIQQNILKTPAQLEQPSPDWPGMRQSQAPFIGRADLLERLNNAYHRRGFVSIKGEAGVGKNRLVEQFYLGLLRKPRLVFCSGKPMVKCAPFEPIIEGLREAVKPEEWLALPDVFKETLQELFPELKAIGLTGENPPEIDVSGDDFLRVCEALQQVLALLAQRKPLLFFIDIAAWLDDATLDFLAFLGDRDFFRKHGLMIIGSRKEETSPGLEVLIDRCLMLGMLEKMEVPLLTMEETSVFIEKTAGRVASPRFLKKIYQQTGGNPYFLVEGMKVLDASSFNIQEDSPDQVYPIPDTIRALISEKTRVLTDDAVRVMRAGAVLGQFFNPEIVEAMEDMPSSHLVTACEELQKYSIVSVREFPDGGLGYSFDHDQLREMVLKEISPLRKRHLHLAAVEASIKLHGHKPELESAYAYHYTEAGEYVKAYNAWIKAAEFARSRFSRSDRYYAYNKAFDLIPRLPQNTLDKQLEELVVRWGDYAYDLGDKETCSRVYGLCMDMGEQTQNPVLLCIAWNGMARVHQLEMNYESGIEAVNRAQFYCDRIDNLEMKLDTLSRLTTLYELMNDTNRVILLGEESLQYLPSLKEQRGTDVMVDILSQLALAYIISGRPTKAIAIGEIAVNLSLLVQRRSAKVQAAAVLAAGQFFVGDYQKSIQNALAVRDLAEKLDFRWWESFLDAILGRDYLALGDMDRSWFYCQTLFEREKNHPNGGIYPLGCQLAGEIYRLYGEYKKSLAMFAKGKDSQPANFQSLECLFYYASMLGETTPEPARKMLEELQTTATEGGLRLITLETRVGLFSVYATPDNYEDQVKELEALKRDLVESGFVSTWFMVDEAQGRIAEKLGKRKEAFDQFKRIAEQKASITNTWLYANALSGMLRVVEDDAQKKRIKADLAKTLAKIGEKSTLPPLRKMFFAYRKRVMGGDK